MARRGIINVARSGQRTIYKEVLRRGVQYRRLYQNGDECQVVDDSEMMKYFTLEGKDVVVTTKPAISQEELPGKNASSGGSILEIYSKSKEGVDRLTPEGCQSMTSMEVAGDVRKIVSSGDPKNRIDVVFMGDGYTLDEKEKFFGDIARLTKEMFEGVTFRSWLPLFNIWAIHVESKESGIGYDGPKNTPFRLYRETGQLRAIFPGNSAYARQVCKLTGEGGCDYPSLIGNDDFYGGLGGEFVIATSSKKSGTVVLRHEMGHNFAKVGEEYDSGQVYSGVNSASSLNQLGWKNWLTGPVREERAMYRILEYPWHDLQQGVWSTTFTSDGRYSRWLLHLTVSAAEKEDSVEFLLDGEKLAWKSSGAVDREFYEWRGASGFTKGSHTFQVRSLKPTASTKVKQMIASVTLHEFGNDQEYNMDNENYSAYPTWDVRKRKTYRPTSEKCLMRNMTSSTFCHVCKEGIWAQFLQRVSLIDSLAFSNNTLELHTPKLGQFRQNGQIPGELLSIEWALNGTPALQYRGSLAIKAPAKGKWSVTVRLITPEIHSNDPAWAKDTQSIQI